MRVGIWGVTVGFVVLPAALVGATGCGGSGALTAQAADVQGITVASLKAALLTHVNGVAASAPASDGKYTAVTSTGNQTAGGVQVEPKACGGSATQGFDPAALSGDPTAAVTFRVGDNDVSEVLIASSAKSASTALAGHVPSDCARYQETSTGKTSTYTVKEQPVAGVGTQAKAVNVQEAGAASDDRWSLIYRGTNFVAVVTVVGPNASEKAVQELGEQAYAFAAKTLS